MHIFGIPFLISYTPTKRTLDSIHFITPYQTLYYNLSLVGGHYGRRIRSQSGRHPTLDRGVRNLLEADVLAMDLDCHATYLDEQVVGIQSGYGSHSTFFRMTHWLISIRTFLAVRRVNDQLMQVERHFIHPHQMMFS